MKKIRNFVIGGIQNKIFNLVLGTTLLILGVYLALSLIQSAKLTDLIEDTNRQQRAEISQVSQETMSYMINDSLMRSTNLEAEIADSMFRSLKEDVEILAGEAGRAFDDPQTLPDSDVPLPDASSDGTVCAQLLWEEGADPGSDAALEERKIIGNLTDLMVSVCRNNERINACYIGTPNGLFVIVDERPASKLGPDGKPLPMPVTERHWYRDAVRKGGLFFTDAERDYFTGEMCVTCAVPIYRDGKLAAVIGADLFLTSLEEAVASSEENGWFLCIVNESGHVVFSPKTEGPFQVLPSDKALDLRFGDYRELGVHLVLTLNGKKGVALVPIDGQEYYVAGSRMETSGWAVLSVVDKLVTEQPERMLEASFDAVQDQASRSFSQNVQAALRMMVLLLLAVFLLTFTNTIVLGKRIVKPLEDITRKIGALGGSNIQFFMDDAYKTGDEIEVLAQSFADLSEKTIRYVNEVTKITAEKERIGTELDMARDIQASQLPGIFPAFPDRKEFDIYATMEPAKEVGGDFYDFFLVDKDHLGMVIADVSGKGVPAALFMMIAKILLKNRLQDGDSPAEALSHANRQLLENNQAEMFVTAWVGVLNIATGEGVAANAGHEHPALRKKDGGFELIKYRHSPALAAMEDVPFAEHAFYMEPGDSVFIYTDGVPEATNSAQELYGTDRLVDALNESPDQSPRGLLNSVRESIREFVGPAVQFDDMTMLCLEYKGKAQDENE